MVLLEECFSESGTRYGQYELLLGAANGSETHRLLCLIQSTGKARSVLEGWQWLLRKGFLPEVAVAGPSPPISFLSHPSKYIFSGTLLPSFSPSSVPSRFCALSVNRAVLAFICRAAKPRLANRFTKAGVSPCYSLVALYRSAFERIQYSSRGRGAVPCDLGDQMRNSQLSKVHWLINII